MKYYIIYNNTAVGPMTKEEMAAYHVTPNTMVAPEGSQNWQPVYTIPELMSYLHQTGKPTYTQPLSADNNRMVCGLCALLIGGIGLQYFLIDKPVAGILTIVITLCTFGLWSIVCLIQGILILCMSDEEFNSKYVDSPSLFPLF